MPQLFDVHAPDRSYYILVTSTNKAFSRMKLFHGLLQASIFALSATKVLAAGWTFTDGTVSVQSRGTGVGGSQKDRFATQSSLASTKADGLKFDPGKADIESHYLWTKRQSQDHPHNTRRKVGQAATSGLLAIERFCFES